MQENRIATISPEIESDFANLAVLAANRSHEDVRMLLAKLVRKYRTTRPDFADRLNSVLRATHTRASGESVLRRTAEPGPEAPSPIDKDSRLSLIRVFDDRDGLAQPLLDAPLLRAVQAIVRERIERVRLAARGVPPTRSAVLVGPPGVGKTLSARWIAAQLGKPLWVLDLTTVMSSLLGKTGSNLRAVFDHARASDAVLLLDEIDAIAKRRSDESDVGELKRLVTGILQEVDAWPDTALLLAATNHPELVDPALWRRFDVVLQFGMPDDPMIEEAVRRFLGAEADNFEGLVPLVAQSFHGVSLSDVERSVMAMRRAAALENEDALSMVASIALQHVEHLGKRARQQLAIELARAGAMSHNRITAITGVSRDTIRKHAGPSPIKGRGGRKDS